jgi:hypothetical protein
MSGTGIDWMREVRRCAEDGQWGSAIYALSMAEPDLAEAFEAIMRRAYDEALRLALRKAL